MSHTMGLDPKYSKICVDYSFNGQLNQSLEETIGEAEYLLEYILQ